MSKLLDPVNHWVSKRPQAFPILVLTVFGLTGWLGWMFGYPSIPFGLALIALVGIWRFYLARNYYLNELHKAGLHPMDHEKAGRHGGDAVKNIHRWHDSIFAIALLQCFAFGLFSAAIASWSEFTPLSNEVASKTELSSLGSFFEFIVSFAFLAVALIIHKGWQWFHWRKYGIGWWRPPSASNC